MNEKKIIEILEKEMVERRKELSENEQKTDDGLTKSLETLRWLERLRALKNKVS